MASMYKRLLVVVSHLLCMNMCMCDRLYLTEGGYARIIGNQLQPIKSFTLSSWINVTKFPEGIAPIMTYFNQDIDSQMAFFIRPDGIGVLWGGPVPSKREPLPELSRRPRYHWGQIDGSSKLRRRREAVDYSGGLGDIENILAKRIGRADDFWAPMNFVDVRDLGVDDLIVSGSHAEDKVDRSGKTYSDWTNVPYELHMAESGPDETLGGGGTPIITKPSGDNDFVYFNWNKPSENARQIQIPLGNNNWSPVWESTREEGAEADQQNIHLQQYNGPTAQVIKQQPSNTWHGQNYDNSNAWDAVQKPDYQQEKRNPLPTKILPNKHERPVWPSSNTRFNPTSHNILPLPTEASIDNSIKEIKKPHYTSPNRNVRKPYNWRTTTSNPEIQSISETTSTTTTTSAPITTTTTTSTTTTKAPKTIRKVIPRRNAVPPLFRYQQNRPTTTRIPLQTSSTEKTTTAKPKQTRARVPLWKLIKKPSAEVPNIAYQPTVPNTTKVSHIKMETRYFPEPTLPPFRSTESPDSLQSLSSNVRNVYRSRPLQSPSRRITRKPILQATTTTAATTPVQTTPRKLVPTPITHRIPNYQGSKIENKFKETTTTKSKYNNKYSSKNVYKSESIYNKNHVNEFEKTMEDPELFREGNTPVIYAVPITNENEFYKMYNKYQEESRDRSNNVPNLHKLYNAMRKGDIKENDAKANKHAFTEAPIRYTTTERQLPTAKSSVFRKTTEEPTTTPTPSTTNTPIKTASKVSVKPPEEEYEYYVYEDENGNPFYEYYNEQNLEPYQNVAEAVNPNEYIKDQSIAEYYTPQQIAIVQATTVSPAYYQEPSKVVHEQLPPQYQKPEKQQQYSSPSNPEEGFIPTGQPQFNQQSQNYDNKELIPQSAVHNPLSNEEAEKWIQENQNKPVVAPPVPTFNPNPSIPILPNQLPSTLYPKIPLNSYPQVPQPPSYSQQPPPPMPLIPQETEPELNIRFEKIPYTFKENGWYHVAYTWDAMTKLFKIFVNGEMVGEISNVLADQEEIREGGIFILGQTLLPDLTDFDSSSQFEGEISDFNLWGMELNSNAIDSVFQCKYDPKSPQPIDWESTPMKLYNQAFMVQSPPFCGLVT